MELKIWDFEQDNKYIDSFLECASKAYSIPKKSEAWFHWKFEQNPYGKAILAYAIEDDIICGSVSMGIGKMSHNGKIFDFVLPHENFVLPSHQGKGLFKKLILLLESEIKNRKLKFGYIMPNSNSLAGYLHNGWIKDDSQKIYIKISNPLECIMNFKDIQKPFIHNESNVGKLKSMKINDFQPFISVDDAFVPIWNKEYLKWRFFTFPVGEYHVTDNEKVLAITRVGKRGILCNAHILYIVPRDNDKRKAVNTVYEDLRKSVRPDMITYSATLSDPIEKYLQYLITRKGGGNFVYKFFDDTSVQNFKISLSGIAAHTY